MLRFFCWKSFHAFLLLTRQVVSGAWKHIRHGFCAPLGLEPLLTVSSDIPFLGHCIIRYIGYRLHESKEPSVGSIRYTQDRTSDTISCVLFKERRWFTDSYQSLLTGVLTLHTEDCLGHWHTGCLWIFHGSGLAFFQIGEIPWMVSALIVSMMSIL